MQLLLLSLRQTPGTISRKLIGATCTSNVILSIISIWSIGQHLAQVFVKSSYAWLFVFKYLLWAFKSTCLLERWAWFWPSAAPLLAMREGAVRAGVAALTAQHCAPCNTWRDMPVPEEWKRKREKRHWLSVNIDDDRQVGEVRVMELEKPQAVQLRFGELKRKKELQMRVKTFIRRQQTI